MPTSADTMSLLLDAARRAGDPAMAIARRWPEDLRGPVHVLATGKASLEMAAAALERLGESAARVLVTAMPERPVPAIVAQRATVLPADHPLPTERNLAAAEAALQFVASVPADATLLLLISGGGSAHLTLPAGNLSLADIRAVTAALQRAGAPIDDLNTVRKHTERLKGGFLAGASTAGRLVALLMSDVREDRPDVIASGPASPDPTTYADALAALTRHGVVDAAPRVADHLRRGIAGEHRESLKPGDPAFARVTSRVIASNQIVKDAVAEAARQKGAFVIRDHRWISGGAAAEGQRIGSTVRRLLTTHTRAVFIAGGEPVVNVGSETGTGGPSQELALAAAQELDGAQRVLLACFSTDGIDGPTRHAGAIVSGDTAAQARSIGTDLADAIARHDSSTLLERLNATITTGPTGTNLNHVMIALMAKAV